MILNHNEYIYDIGLELMIMIGLRLESLDTQFETYDTISLLIFLKV